MGLFALFELRFLRKLQAVDGLSSPRVEKRGEEG